MKNCVLCNSMDGNGELELKESGHLVSCFMDGYPVTKYHMLFVPNRHVETYFNLWLDEVTHINAMMKRWVDILKKNDNTITGFNIGWNCGESAGQTIDHAHCHLIPRRDGDVEDPTGGIRNVIPDKCNYLE